ncbi:MAG: hypothetical protein WCO49_16035, partial [Nostocales cyanobacterium ELA608]
NAQLGHNPQNLNIQHFCYYYIAYSIIRLPESDRTFYIPNKRTACSSATLTHSPHPQTAITRECFAIANPFNSLGFNRFISSIN